MIEKPHELKKIEILESRLQLSNELLTYKNRILKGFEGECAVENMLQPYRSEILFLHDLYLSGTHTSHVQIDILIISRGRILLLEVKNLEGTHISKGDFLVNKRGFEFQNPKVQVLKSQNILQSILTEAKFTSYSIDSFVVYTHQSFKLYNETSQDLSYSLDNLEHYILQNIYTKPGITKNDQELAKIIMDRVKFYEHSHELIPKYNLGDLNLKMSCPECRNRVVEWTRKSFQCQNCFLVKLKSEILEYNIMEYQLLFNTLPSTAELRTWTANMSPFRSCSTAITNYKRK